MCKNLVQLWWFVKFVCMWSNISKYRLKIFMWYNMWKNCGGCKSIWPFAVAAATSCVKLLCSATNPDYSFRAFDTPSNKVTCLLFTRGLGETSGNTKFIQIPLYHDIAIQGPWGTRHLAQALSQPYPTGQLSTDFALPWAHKRNSFSSQRVCVCRDGLVLSSRSSS